MVNQQLRAEFHGVRRVMGKPLSAERSVCENLRRLAAYSTKLKVAYCDAWGGRITKFGANYESEWIASIELTIRNLGLQNLLFIHGGVSTALPIHAQLLGGNLEDSCAIPPDEQPSADDDLAAEPSATKPIDSDGSRRIPKDSTAIRPAPARVATYLSARSKKACLTGSTAADLPP